MQNAPYDHRADIYSFGITAWEVLSDNVPFADCAGPVQIILRIVQGGRPAIPLGGSRQE